MGEVSKIEWTDATFNPWIGCTAVSAACDHCYAEALSKARLGVAWGKGEPRRRTSAANWKLPLRWNRKAEREGRRLRVFCASLADVFDSEVPEGWRDELFALIAETPHLDWLLLTKRPKAMRDYADRAHRCGEHWLADQPDAPAVLWPLSNVWLGTTVEDQKMAEVRIPHLLATPAAVRFLSMEPLLGPVDLTAIPWRFNGCSGETVKTINALTGNITVNDPVFGGGGGIVGLDWVITGGESGPGARASHPEWFRSISRQCTAAGVPFLFKQWGEWAPREAFINYPKQVRIPLAQFQAGEERLYRVGRKVAGRLLNGVTWDEVPEVTP